MDLAASAAGMSVVRAAPDSHVLLVPELDVGVAGWCMATATKTTNEGSSGCGAPAPSTGPVLAEGCEESSTAIHVYVLTRGEVAAVSVAGGRPIPTRVNPTLPDGLRAAAIEVLRHDGEPHLTFGRRPCLRMTLLGTNGKAIQGRGRRNTPLAAVLPGAQLWNAHPEPAAEACAIAKGESPSACKLPTAPPAGVCQLTATRLPAQTEARRGAVASEIRAYPNLLGQAFLSCVNTDYFYLEEHSLESAVLLDAAHPGSTPPPLPDMKPLAGYPGIFEAPGCEGTRVARRIPGAWLVVEENDEIGVRVPVELLDDLQATINL